MYVAIAHLSLEMLQAADCVGKASAHEILLHFFTWQIRMYAILFEKALAPTMFQNEQTKVDEKTCLKLLIAWLNNLFSRLPHRFSFEWSTFKL